MTRILLAAMTLLALAACSPSVKIDPDDPWKSLYPWHHNWKEIHKLPSGVEYVVVRKGDGKGASPLPADQVEVHYDGRFAKTGEKFDSSYDRGETSTFPLNRVISGWTEGMQKMKPGDEFMFWIPSDMGYGPRGRDQIPPNADLMFQVELFKVTPAVSADVEAWKKVTPWPTQSSAVIRKSSGLEYLVIDSAPDDAISPSDRDYVYVHLEGRLEDGSVVGSTYDSQQPERFPMADLTPGWSELLKLMRKGDHWMVRMPAHLMYADEGDGRIPPGATVIYEVRLENIVVIDPPPEPVAPPPKPDKPGKPSKPAKPN